MSENKRLKNVIFWLISQEIIENQEDLAQKLGYNPSAFSQIVTGIKPISKKFAQKLTAFCKKINYNYLFAEGEMLKNQNEIPTFLQTERKLIPFYDINVEAGTKQISNMDAEIEPTEWIDAGDWFRDADTAMRVHGDSMFPVYKSGSIVVMKEVYDKRLIMYGQDYVLQTSEYKVIKRLQKSNTNGCWLACSTNNEIWEKGELVGRLIHEPFDIPIDLVNKIFRVLGCVNRTESSRIIYAKQQIN
jgi:SOS-response transcriptional repressor LexA